MDPAKTSDALETVERNTRLLAQLIEDLLDVSRIVSGEWRLTLSPVEVAPAIRAAVDVMQPAADAKGVKLDVSLPAGRVPVLGDSDRLQQVISNLLSNAVKFTPRGGQVQVTLERLETSARIVVRDTGEGIAPDFLPHVFERFRQADSSATRWHGGLGLGLAIVRTLVELHGGTVRADSRGKGLGAVFTVEVPLTAEAESAIESVTHHEPAAAETSLGGLHVLVVDDDPGSNAVVSAVLASRGVEVRTAASTPEALEIAGRWAPDVLVSDIAMPGEDGYALLEKLRARERDLGRIPAIALTAYAGSAERRRLLAAGFEAHIEKPFDPVELAAAVEEAASRGRMPAA
jgi:CheY-like chemotaxis protein